MARPKKREKRLFLFKEENADWFAAALARFGRFPTPLAAWRFLRRWAIPVARAGEAGRPRYLRVRVGCIRRRSKVPWMVHLHRLVMAYALGRVLRGDEHVHHVDGNGLNNHPSNLRLCSSRHAHDAEHGRDGVILEKRRGWAAWRYRLPGWRRYRSLRRLVMEVTLGRKLRREEVVLTLSGKPLELRPPFLEVVTRAEVARRMRIKKRRKRREKTERGAQ